MWFATTFRFDCSVSLKSQSAADLMAKKKATRFTPLLSAKWEKIDRVRSRFRRGAGWLKFAKGDEGDDIVQCTPSLSCNFEVLSVALETCGLKLQSTKALKREAGWVPVLSKN